MYPLILKIVIIGLMLIVCGSLLSLFINLTDDPIAPRPRYSWRPSWLKRWNYD